MGPTDAFPLPGKEIRMSEENSAEDDHGDHHQHSLYMLVLLVMVFFVMGLVGFLICHVLKKKGYRCRTFSDEFESDNKESLTPTEDDKDEELNEDTVEKIVKCIIQNEANVEVLKEMLGEGDTDPPLPIPVPSGLCPHRSSQDGGLPHHHTVHLGSTQAPCIHCSRKKRHSLHRQGRSKEGKGKMQPGETTVFSVGRFHVTHIGKKSVSHESQEESPSDNKQNICSTDASQELHSSEKSQWEGSLNGIVQVDGLQQGTLQQTDSQCQKGLKEDRADESIQGKDFLIVITNPDHFVNRPERKESPNVSSLQQSDLPGTAKSCIFDINCSEGPRSSCSEDLEKVKSLDEKAGTTEEEGVQRASNEASENNGSKFLQTGPKVGLSVSGYELRSGSSIAHQITAAPCSGLPTELTPGLQD
uniref:RELT like 2 n=1 Tax=Anolis carolinensis TaxID=28377 RepID=G1KLH2_ANOCA|nr:PREDICTED: RELT-like protein 2 isoform X1 [Anolis carolinensis]|eukprot:XP_008107209.1 PREDICTED: RELT-like protein 2 isoform X1 [Anolis carolinensis]